MSKNRLVLIIKVNVVLCIQLIRDEVEQKRGLVERSLETGRQYLNEDVSSVDDRRHSLDGARGT